MSEFCSFVFSWQCFFIFYFNCLMITVQRKCCPVCTRKYCSSCGKNRPIQLFPEGTYLRGLFIYLFIFFIVVYITCKILIFCFLFQDVNLWKLMGDFNLHGITAPGKFLTTIQKGLWIQHQFFLLASFKVWFGNNKWGWEKMEGWKIQYTCSEGSFLTFQLMD